MFTRKHLYWLASWAGQNVGPKAANSLATDLAGTNPHFRKDKFLAEYNRVRNAVRSHEWMHWALAKPDPITKATMDAHRRQSADIELTAALRASGFGNKTNSEKTP
jgi:hypothetical protein